MIKEKKRKVSRMLKMGKKLENKINNLMFTY